MSAVPTLSAVSTLSALSGLDCIQGPPVDVWSLGVVYFAMLCGRMPFSDVSGVTGVTTGAVGAFGHTKDAAEAVITLDPTLEVDQTVPPIFHLPSSCPLPPYTFPLSVPLHSSSPPPTPPPPPPPPPPFAPLHLMLPSFPFCHRRCFSPSHHDSMISTADL